jgi:hypothetical protein
MKNTCAFLLCFLFLGAPARAGGVYIINKAPVPVVSLFISPDVSPEWGKDRLPGLLPYGSARYIPFVAGTVCRFDIKVLFALAAPMEFDNVDLCATKTLKLFYRKR